jgi:hypothetical protein
MVGLVMSLMKANGAVQTRNIYSLEPSLPKPCFGALGAAKSGLMLG